MAIAKAILAAWMAAPLALILSSAILVGRLASCCCSAALIRATVFWRHPVTHSALSQRAFESLAYEYKLRSDVVIHIRPLKS